MVNKSEEETGRLDLLFRALGDRNRRRMLERLAQGPATVGELGAPLDISKPAVTKHLKVLERAGLLERRVEGRIHRCRTDPRVIERAREWIDRYRAFWEHQLDGVAAILERDDDREERR